jgi:hypothetical protein|tara:strand:- start:102 stop:395 length:294 start_codon:yes stop_codon:yes gene_type:complete
MSRSYPIWNEINSCAYSEAGKRTGNKSYGVKEHSEINVKVGSSASHSFDFCQIKQTKKRFGQWSSFQISIDGKIIKRAYFNNKTKKFTRRKPKEIKI